MVVKFVIRKHARDVVLGNKGTKVCFVRITEVIALLLEPIYLVFLIQDIQIYSLYYIILVNNK